MIVTIPAILALTFLIKDVSSASYSTVYKKNGPEYPVEYVEYGSPSLSYSPQTARLTAAPAGPVVSYSPNYSVSPCGTPCIYPEPVAPVAPGANIVQYTAPSLPVVVAPSRSEPSSYEYSYVVYNEPTGDHKAQRESSDGSVVRGGYTFLQPDGYIREVQYVADDLQGFNAVVKHYVPEIVETKKQEHHEKTDPEPCHGVKNEQVVYEDHEEHVHGNYHAEPTHESLKNHPYEEEHKGNELYTEAPHDTHNEEAHKAVVVYKKHLIEKPSQDAYDEKLTKHAATPVEYELPQQAHTEHHEAVSKTVHIEHAPPNAEIEISKGPAREDIHHTALQEHHIPVVEPSIDNSNILIPYSDIIRCIQAALRGTHDVSIHKQESPLGYIILNKPC